jgi:hypothetical protein
MENFTRGAIVGRAGVVIGAGLSALIGNWAGKKWGKSETSGRTWALIGSGLSVAGAAFTNKQSTGQFFPSGEVIAAHRAWLQSTPAPTIMMPGANIGPQLVEETPQAPQLPPGTTPDVTNLDSSGRVLGRRYLPGEREYRDATWARVQAENPNLSRGEQWAFRDEIVNRWIVEQGGTPKGTLLALGLYGGYRW